MRNTITSSIRQGIRNTIKNVLGSLRPLFDLPAMKTLVPTTGTTPTFTRATTKTGTNFDGQVFTAKANEPIFEGARRVENLLTASEDMTNAAYATANGATVDSSTVASFDGSTAGQIQNTPPSGGVTVVDDGSGVGGRTFVFSVEIKLISGTITTDSDINIILQGNAITSVTLDIGNTLTSEPQRFSVTASTDAAGTQIYPIVEGNIVASLEITKWQVEEVTGQTNQNPSEYVSTGVATGSESYDTANAVSLTNETNATTGFTVATAGTILRTSEVNTDSEGGDYMIQTLTTVGSPAGRVYQDLDASPALVYGKTYGMTLRVASTGTGSGSGYWSINLADHNNLTGDTSGFYSPTTTSSAGIRDADGTGVFHTFTQTFVHSADTRYLVFRSGSTANDGGFLLSSISVKEASHGANIDGVQYFLQTNPNTVNGGVVTSDEQHWLELDGNSGSYASTPDTPENSITGSITFIACAAYDDWTPATDDRAFISKWVTAGSQRSFIFRINSTTGTLQIVTSSNGSNAGLTTSTVATGFVDGTAHWVRATLDSASDVVNFYTSDESALTPYDDLSWNLLGDPDQAHTTGVFDGTSDVEVGAIEAGTSDLVEGSIIRAVIIPSTDPTAAASVDFNAQTAIADGWTIHSTGDTQLKTNKALTFTEERTGPIALSTALDRDDGFNSSSILHGSVLLFPNLLPPAARTDFTEWTKTGTGSITPVGVGDGTEIVSAWQSGSTAPDILEIDGLDMRIARSTAGTKIACSQSLTITEGTFYKVKFTSTLNSGSYANVNIKFGSDYSLTTFGGLNQLVTEGVNEIYLYATGTDTSARIGFRVASMADFNVTDWEFEEATYSYTTLSDEDDTYQEMRIETEVTVPVDTQTYRVPITLSAGTSDLTDIRLRFKDGTGASHRVRVTWATLATSSEEGSPSNISLGANGDGTYTLSFEADNSSTNATAQVMVFPAGEDATTQGTVNVHGDVVLNRVSVAAEPTWNTLRPGDSVEQLLLQQQDFDTTWGQPGTPTITQTETDVFGNASSAYTISDTSAVAWEYLSQTVTVDADATYTAFVFVKKEAADTGATGCMRITLSTGGSYDIIIDPFTGLANEAGPDPLQYGVVDGEIIKELMPIYANADNYWLYYAIIPGDGVDTTAKINLFPAFGTNFTSGGETAAAIGAMTFNMPTFYEGNGVFFFDSIATTTTVTEVVQDWSKIFSYSTEADDNVANIVFDHNYLEGAGVNIEGARTNVLLQSNAFDTTWTSSNSVETASYAIAPDGTKTAWYLGDDSATGTGAVYTQAALTVSSGANYASIHGKADQLDYIALKTTAVDAGGLGTTWFNIANGTIGTVSANHTNPTIEVLPNGYFRVGISFTTTTDLTAALRVHVASVDNALTSVPLDGTSSILIWGAQLEAGSFPSSYIKTEGSAATRNADLLTYSAVGVADTFPMTAYAESIQSVDQSSGSSNSFALTVSEDVSPSHDLFYMRAYQSGENYQGVVYSGTALQSNITGGVPVAGTLKKLTMAVALNDVEMYVDGVSIGSDTTVALPATPALISVGSQAGGGTPAYGNIRNVKIFDKRLTDAEVSKL